jgi:hypothetical protein
MAARFCGVACQRAAWGAHRRVCAPPPPPAQDDDDEEE